MTYTTYRITQRTTGVILDEIDAATPLDAYRAHMARVGYPTEERAQSAGYTLAEIPADLAVVEVEDEGDPAAVDAETSTFAVVDLDGGGEAGTIVELHELTDRQRDEMAREHGRRLVYLPGGGEVGDWVILDGDGEAEVVP